MTLQNKKTHLLDNNDTESDVDDLFDKYGGGDDTPQTQASSATPMQTQDSMRPQTDNEAHPEEMVELKTEKKWEQEYEEESPQKQVVAQEPVKKVPEPKEAQSPAPKAQESKKDVVPKPQPKKIPTAPVPPKAKTPKKQDSNVSTGHQSMPAQQKKSVQPKSDTPLQEINIDHSKKTIMIVDDDIDTLEMYADVFESANYNIIRAADGLEAMNLIADHTPHVIFTGIVMPRMDGFSMMEALKQNKRTENIPVVINSHLGRDTDKDKAEELGARDFIIRGFTQPREVVERVGALLLRSDYIFRFNKTDKDVQKLAKDLGASSFFHCPQGQEMVLKLNVTDEKDLTFAARFSCIDIKKNDKK